MIVTEKLSSYIVSWKNSLDYSAKYWYRQLPRGGLLSIL